MKMTTKLARTTALYAMRTALTHAARAKDAAARAGYAADRAADDDDDDGYAAAARIHAHAADAHAADAYAAALIAAEASNRVHNAKTPTSRAAALAMANDAESDAFWYANRACAAYRDACNC